jgi:hypothetical protein
MSTRVRVRSVEPLSGARVRLGFTNGESREIDLEPYLHGPVFESIRNNSAEFRAVRVDPELGTIVWPNGADIDPDVLYEGLTPAWQETEKPASR